MDWIGLLLGIGGIVFGGGCTWIFTVKSIRRKEGGEAVHAEADGWKAMQDVYQQTIDDLNKYCADMRKDREFLREENARLSEENNKLRERYNELEERIIELRKEIARQGRRIEALLPFTCGMVACGNRSKVDIQEMEEGA